MKGPILELDENRLFKYIFKETLTSLNITSYYPLLVPLLLFRHTHEPGFLSFPLACCLSLTVPSKSLMPFALMSCKVKSKNQRIGQLRNVQRAALAAT